MKKNVVIIGPLPPPIHGVSLAVKLIKDSKIIAEKFNLKIINTNKKEIKGVGVFSFKKIMLDITNIIKITSTIYNNEKPILYITIAQSKLGLLRDSLIIRICKKKTEKIILHLHGNKLAEVIDKLNYKQKKFISGALSKVDYGIVLGKNLEYNFKGLVKNIRVIPNGIDENFITEKDIKKSVKHKNNDFTNLQIVYLSNLMRSKGYLKLIEAVMNLNNSGHNVSLSLAGAIEDINEFNTIFKHVREQNLNMKIVYKGIVTGDIKKEFLLSGDVIVLPSEFEGQPMCLIEAMAASLPIIATNTGAITDLIDENGMLLELPSVENIENAILNILSNKNMLCSMGKRSRELFSEKFTLSKHIENIIEVLN